MRANHRRTLILSGARDWTLEVTREASAALGEGSLSQRPIWFTDRASKVPKPGRGPAPLILPLGSGTRVIGAETELLVYDAWSGLDPDGLGAATGALKGGGLLLLLSPPVDTWAEFPDPQAGRIAVWPHAPEEVGRRFQRRLRWVLLDQPGVTLVREGAPVPEPPPRPNLPPPRLEPLDRDPSAPATADQRAAIEALLRLARGRAHRPLILIAHRGRGKSAALGIAAGLLTRERPRRILVTAPRAAACEALFRHFALASGGPEGARTGIAKPPEPLRFLAPDALVETRPPAELLLVDEAAGIPSPLLTRLLGHYPRVCFATTVHGYEGTGRGFEVRFRDSLDRLTPGWRQLTLETPIRWSLGDPLEALVFRALLLDASPAELEPPSPAPTNGVVLRRLDREALSRDEPTLRQVFGLLVMAHYQTRPLDLRMLLDGPNVRVYALLQGERILATLLATEEGGMGTAGLRRAIFMGRRRPRGHLLPQTLSAHGGLEEAPALRYLRVVRVAVHPALRRQGLAARLLRRLALDGRREGLDLIGTSFGATPGLIAFWSACRFRPALLGSGRNAASGEHALVMLKPLRGTGWRLATRAEGRLKRHLGLLLAGPLRRLDPLVAAALTQALGPPGRQPRPVGTRAARSRDEGLELHSFIQGHRTLEAALPVLAGLVDERLGPALRAGRIAPEEGALLIAALRQLRPMDELVDLASVPGREALIQRLRGLAGTLAGP